MVEILIKKHYTSKDYTRNALSTGKRMGKPVGSYIVDLADLKKPIVLCSSCLSGFNPKAHHYERWNYRNVHYVSSTCDACKEQSNRAHMFVHETLNY
ncbi:MAG: hypothetical protein BMS9Abin21_185 [Thermodesulfovibrionia bacterium]|nr:MAG: hypothetical protein BMS9Abin21_185 [Thermodesulfovibrionia bacterium]